MSGALEPLSLEDVKGNLRVDTDDDDNLINDLITEAREYLEENWPVVLVSRSITETATNLGAFIELRSWPVVSIDAIRYPVAGVMTPLTTGAWLFSPSARPVRVLPAARGWGVGAWPVCSSPALPVEIDITAGYESPGDVPGPIKRAMHMLITHWYTNRSTAEVGARAAAIEVPFGVAQIMRRRKLWKL